MTEPLPTVTESLTELAAEGFDGDFLVTGHGLRCGTCGAITHASEVVVGAIHRFEGPSDPGDEMILVALTCSSCGQRGTLVCGYGPSTSPPETEILQALHWGRAG